MKHMKIAITDMDSTRHRSAKKYDLCWCIFARVYETPQLDQAMSF